MNSDGPVEVEGVGGSGFLSGVSSLETGDGDYCALVAGGVDCWGYGGDYELGNNSTADSDVPVEVEGVGGSGLLRGVSSLATDDAGYCALVSGDLDCWGDGVYATPVDEGLSGVTSVVSDEGSAGSPGSGSYCAMLSSGAVDCAGSNAYGELGDGNMTTSATPVAVEGVGGVGSLSGVASVFSDGAFSYCALLSSGGVDCWGNDSTGELGDNNPGTTSDVPVVVQAVGGGGSLSGVASLTNYGYESYCAVLTSTAVDCWGEGFNGELGDGSTSQSAVPVVVQAVGGGGSLTDVASVVSTGIYVDESYCALLTSGRQIDCWGDSTHGELGNGSMTQSNVPVAVTGIGP